MNADPAAPLRRPPSLRTCCLLACCVFLSTWGQSWLFHDHLSLPTVYFGPGVALAALYMVERPSRGRMLAALFVAQAAGSMAAGRPPGVVLIATSIVAGQAWVGAAVLRLLAPNGMDFTKARAFANLALVALLVAPPSGFIVNQLLIHANPALLGMAPAAPGATLAGQLGGILRTGMLTGWILPHALGIVLAVPLTIGFSTPLRHRHAALRSRERTLILAGNLAASVAIFFSDGHSYLFLICPALVWAGLRLGVRDTASAVLISLSVASVAAALGYGPAEVLQIDPGHRTVFIELAYLCACACTMPIAASLEARRRLEADLASSLEFTGQILSNMHEIVFRTDSHGRWTFLNPAWQNITGYTRAETLGQKYTALLVDDDRAKASSVYAGLVSGDVDEMRIQQRIRRRDGEVRDVEISARAFRSPEGSYLGTAGTIRDMSEHRRYIEALEASERRFRQLCDTAPIGIIRCDRGGIVSYANLALETIALTRLENLVGTAWLDILDSESRDLTQHLNDVLQSPGAVFEQELSFDDATGVRRWLIVTATGEFDADLLPIGYIAAVNDITARKAAEAELASRTTELRLLTDNINDMIFRLGLDRTYLYATPTVREVMGLDPELIVGRKAFTRVHPDDQQIVDIAFEQVASGAVRHNSFIFRALPSFPEADYIWVEANCRLVRDEAGKPHEVVTATRDISERKRLELAIVDAHRRAELATLAKSAFIANLSHEIRTPMNGVIGLTDLLLSRDLDEPSRRYAKLIAESGAAMMHLLNDILDISKIDSGRLQLTNEEFDLHRCLANSLSLMHASAGGKRLDLRLDIAPGLPRMMVGDSLRLRQVMANLIGNAVKFTEVGHVVVGARLDGPWLEIRVEDTGIGIRDEQLSAVFEEFVQASQEITSGYGGTGLGLSIARRISEVMGGTLTLTSKYGTGTTLKLRIPANFIEMPEKIASAAAEPSQDASHRALHILVAEDNRTNQIIINGMLHRLGHSTALAHNGEEVIAMVEQAAAAHAPFDLVLMDIQMPKMDGIEACGRLRKMGFDALHLPIIAVTASGYQEDIEICIAAGMQHHLTKPMRLADLKAALAALSPGETTAEEPLGSPPRQARSR